MAEHLGEGGGVRFPGFSILKASSTLLRNKKNLLIIYNLHPSPLLSFDQSKIDLFKMQNTSHVPKVVLKLACFVGVYIQSKPRLLQAKHGLGWRTNL